MEEGLLRCLYQTLDSDHGVRQAAESQLQAASAQAGYGVALARVSLQREVPFGIRQLAAVVLKQYVKHHWTPSSKHFAPPACDEGDKAAIRALLPDGLRDETPKIRTAIGMAIAGIAKWDWPEAWPDLLPLLVNMLRTRPTPDAVHGAVRCLSLFAGDIDDRVMPELLPVLLPELLFIVAGRERYGAGVQRRALRVLYSCIATISNMDRGLGDATRTVILPLLPPWFEQFVALLSTPTSAEDPADWGIKMEALKILVIAISCFGKHISGMVPSVMAPCWNMFVNCFPIYEATVIADDGDIDGGELDSDGENLDFEALISQLFELLLTLVGNNRYKGLVAGSVGQLMYTALAYMQMTRDQAITWARDPNQYVADEEDDTFSVRVSGEMLLEELMQQFGADAVTALSQATQTRLQDAQSAKAAGNPNWWRIREAALLAVGSMGENLKEAAEEGQLTFDVAGFMDNVLSLDLGSNCDCPFLVGRALWVSSRLFPFVPEDKRTFFMRAGAAGLALHNPPPVRIGACRAVAQFCPHAGPAGLGDMTNQLYQGLGLLLGNSEEEVLHLVLETLLAVIQADEAAATSWEPSLSEAVFRVWGNYANDPLISIDAFDVLGALVAVPTCQRALLGRLLPHICHIISSCASQPNDGQPSSVVEGALDILVLFLKRVPAELAVSVHGVAFAPIMALMRSSGDAGQLQSGTDIVRLFVKAGGEGMLTWNGADAEASLQAVLEVVARLLRPESGDSAPLHVGPLIAQLLAAMPGRVGGMLPTLLQAIVEKLPHTNSSLVITGLLMVFCRLIHMNANELLDFLASRPSPVPSAGTEGDSALGFVMRLWMERQVEIQGQLNIKLSTTAIALLLTSRHPALGGVMVKGRRLDTGGAIRTRSRAKTQAERWSTVALPVKLVEVLSDALIEAQEQTTMAGGGDEDYGDEDDDWEEEDGKESSGKSFGMDLFEFLSNRAEDEHVVDDEEAKADPLYTIDLPAFIADKLRISLGSDVAFKEAAWQHLTALQQAAVHHSLTSA